jgi:prepilin-type N-terminal cleavage/methylation domain-containing protein
MDHRRSRAALGLTLIELLVVMAIIAVLIGMLMPMIGVTMRTVQRTRTEVVLRKVDAALRQFRGEFGVYPYQLAYPDLDAGERLADRPNRLGYHLARDLAEADRQRVLADMDAAAGAYCDENAAAPLRFTVADAGGANRAALLNRMGRQRARLALLAGDTAVGGTCFVSATSGAVVDRRGTPALSGAAASADRPGWAHDYLAGDLGPLAIDPETHAIRDDYGTPLAYVSQNLPGIVGTRDIINGEQLRPFDSRLVGLGPQGFAPTAGPGPGLVAQGRLALLCSGRIRLSRTDAGDGQPTPTDAERFPDREDLMHSDVRYYAAPGYEAEFELWSAGPDRGFAWMRDAQANRDNIAVSPYLRGLR